MRSSIFQAAVGFAMVAGATARPALADGPDAVTTIPQIQTDETRPPHVESNWDAGTVIVGQNVPYGEPGAWQPGGYEGRIGSPYYYSVPQGYDYAYYYGEAIPYYHGAPYPYHSPPYYASYDRGVDVVGAVQGAESSAAHLLKTFAGAPVVHSNPYAFHFGPGFYRFSDIGHIRFPYYSYRYPFYFPGHPVFSRTMNVAW
jgi:hypothetical protein